MQIILLISSLLSASLIAASGGYTYPHQICQYSINKAGECCKVHEELDTTGVYCQAVCPVTNGCMTSWGKCCDVDYILVNDVCTAPITIVRDPIVVPVVAVPVVPYVPIPCQYSINFSGACCGIYQELDFGRNCVNICPGGAQKDKNGNCCDKTGLQIIKNGSCLTIEAVPGAIVPIVNATVPVVAVNSTKSYYNMPYAYSGKIVSSGAFMISAISGLTVAGVFAFTL